MKEFHAFGRCITVVRLDRRTCPSYRFLTGGDATEWPWWEVHLGRFNVSVSRVHPRPRRNER